MRSRTGYSYLILFVAAHTATLATGARAAVDWSGIVKDVRKIPCISDARTSLRAWETIDEWSLMSVNGGEKVFQSPTRAIGSWVELHLSPKAPPTAYRIQKNLLEKIAWKSDCDVDISVRELKTLESTAGAFTDHDLRKLVLSGKSGLIYVWSPSFPYALKAFPAFVAAARERKVSFTVLMGSGVDVAKAKKLAREFKVKGLSYRVTESFDLFRRGSAAHQPIVFFYANGRIQNASLRGYREKEEYSQWIGARMVRR